MTDRYYSYRVIYLLVSIMKNGWNEIKPSDKYTSTFNRQLKTQLYTELRREYAFPRAVCRSLTSLFYHYLDLYFGGLRKEGQIVFHAVACDVPPGVPVEEMHLVPVLLTVYSADDILICSEKNQKGVLQARIERITTEAFHQGGLLSQADISIVLGESTKTIARHIHDLHQQEIFIPTRGNWKDIGPGESHKKQIIACYLRGDEYTDIARKTHHSPEAIMRYVKDFARLLILSEEGYTDHEIRMLSGLSDKTIEEYQDLINKYQGPEYEERLAHLHQVFQKKTLKEYLQERQVFDNDGRLKK